MLKLLQNWLAKLLESLRRPDNPDVTPVPTPTPVPQPPTPPPTPEPTSIVTQVLLETNGRRERAGKAPLILSPNLTLIAQAHSDWMADRHIMSHNEGNVSPFDRMHRAGYTFRAAAENIAAGQRTATEVVEAWFDDTPHRMNLLGDYTHLGVGYSNGYWTCDYAVPAGAGTVQAPVTVLCGGGLSR